VEKNGAEKKIHGALLAQTGCRCSALHHLPALADRELAKETENMAQIIAILAFFLTAPAQAKLVKTVYQKPNERVTAETLPAARACEGNHRTCRNGRSAGLVLPTCERVCPEDNRHDLACYAGLAEDADPSLVVWEEREDLDLPVIYSEGGEGKSMGAGAPLDCEVFEIVKQPKFPAGKAYAPSHGSLEVRPAR
jgi:hypothetical protein